MFGRTYPLICAKPEVQKQQAGVLMRVMCGSVLAGGDAAFWKLTVTTTQQKQRRNRSFEYIKGGLKQYLVALMVRCSQ